jgi:formylglycine-generating enzyme required for sulfatase activity
MASVFSKRVEKESVPHDKTWAELARTDPERLHTLALNDPIEENRLVAVQFITDQKMLEEIVRREYSLAIRTAALKRITDPNETVAVAVNPMVPEELRRLALESAGPDPRLRAVYRATASELFRESLINALGGLQDDQFWLEVARLDPNPTLRARAMAQIKADEVYIELYRYERDIDLSRMLTDFVRAPELLRRMMDIQPVEFERLQIVGRIRDEALLAELVRADRSLTLRLTVLDRIEDPVLVRELAQENVPVEVALRALERIQNEKQRAEVAMYSPHEEVRIEALRLITDEDVLERLEEKAPKPEIRWLAGRRVGSMPVKAINEITNGETLRLLIEREQEPEVATWLVNRVTDQETLRVLGGSSFPGTLAAQRRLREREGPLGLRFLQVPGRPYDMSVFPVTIAQLRQVLGPDAGGKGNVQLPATKVTHADAEKFCKFLTETGGGLYRLPSYEEWWHTCVAGDENWLDAQIGQMSWAEALVGTRRLAFGCSGRRPAVAAWPNPWGFLDMVGNVAVWVDDPLNYWMHLAADDPLAVGGDFSNDSSFSAAAGVTWADGKVSKARLRRVVARSALSSWAVDKVGVRVVFEPEGAKSPLRYKVTLLAQTAPEQTKERAILMIASRWPGAADRVAAWYRVAPITVLAGGTYAEAKAIARLLESCGALAQLSPNS